MTEKPERILIVDDEDSIRTHPRIRKEQMKDMDKTKEQLVSELEEMRQRIALFEASQTDHNQHGKKPLETEEGMMFWLTNNLIGY